MIEVGEYVRDIDGFIVKVNEIQEYKEEDDIWYEEKTLKGTWKSMIVKHSKNIIDLIEVGDYVNGEIVIDIGERGLYLGFGEGELYSRTFIDKNEIKEILTKEQYEANSYKIN